jgi:hypothetical protein
MKTFLKMEMVSSHCQIHSMRQQTQTQLKTKRRLEQDELKAQAS